MDGNIGLEDLAVTPLVAEVNPGQDYTTLDAAHFLQSPVHQLIQGPGKDKNTTLDADHFLQSPAPPLIQGPGKDKNTTPDGDHFLQSPAPQIIQGPGQSLLPRVATADLAVPEGIVVRTCDRDDLCGHKTDLNGNRVMSGQSCAIHKAISGLLKEQEKIQNGILLLRLLLECQSCEVAGGNGKAEVYVPKYLLIPSMSILFRKIKWANILIFPA